MNGDITQLWVYLSTSPLVWLTVTLLAYQLGVWVFQRFGFSPILNPVLTAVLVLVILLKLTGTEYQAYFKGAQFIHFLLGPATVALKIRSFTVAYCGQVCCI